MLAQHAYQEGIRLAQQPGRAFDEQHAGIAVAEANLALVACGHGDRKAARSLMALAHDRLPADPAIARVYDWMKQDWIGAR